MFSLLSRRYELSTCRRRLPPKKVNGFHTFVMTFTFDKIESASKSNKEDEGIDLLEVISS